MLRIGTRGSELALWQANHLKDKLKAVDIDCVLVVIRTKGDQIQHLGFDKIEGKGFFTKEIEDALIDDNIDIAVHSLKDLPTAGDERLTIAGLSERGNPADWLIIHPSRVDRTNRLKLSNGAKIGTSSIRRKVQMGQFSKNIELRDIRGNVPTRIEKLLNLEVDALILAAAGIERLGLDLGSLEVVKFHPAEFVPAPGQGVNAYQCRKKDLHVRRIINKIHDRSVARCTNIERTILRLLDGGCQLPLGVYCTQDVQGHYHANAILGSPDDDTFKKCNYSSSTSAGMAEYIVSQLS